MSCTHTQKKTFFQAGYSSVLHSAALRFVSILNVMSTEMILCLFFQFFPFLGGGGVFTSLSPISTEGDYFIT